MLVWLEFDLQANQKQCTMVYFHHPLFSSGASHGGSPDRAKAIWDLLYSYDADVVVNGHEHQYERFAPQDPNGVEDAARGIGAIRGRHRRQEAGRIRDARGQQ